MSEFQGRRIRWGIMGTGRVCNDFVQALKIVEGAEIAGVCSRSLERAQEFATRHGISRAYGSYEEIAADPELDIMYIGSLHTLHKEHAEMSLNNGKHCLVEKPFTCTYEDAEFLINLAQEKGLFIMEGLWTRFFPAVRKAAELIEEGILGPVVQVRADFGFDALGDNETPEGDMFNVETGGGGAFYVAPYPASLALLGFSGQGEPTAVRAAGLLGPTGIDTAATVALTWPGAGVAQLSYSLLGETDEECDIVGKKGRIRINTPFHCPTSLTVTVKNEGRGNVERETLEFPLPDEPPAIAASGGFNYPNSIGFSYEAAAVQQCLRAGRREAPECPHRDILLGMKIITETRSQLGVGESKGGAPSA
ncbi:unnamed protein product [Heterosigma akashiwo]|mmetsp:Transcript_15470/g.24402  ORF Transcript_15470/g.24402 Transcript_15470/m.24402 type:complete len:364 (+) Transcript_15470:45-1136(+)|eukprot:CAMPEP_0206387054 /NCGR_PEP_ID=MMETSP0294-20121207/16354_1 /ASSEMBLY_ACC=CAM_ASM_000327 /TAXON_ID=39354 /ORGANISM="Heterosigma akashiwo, Strain CCMP2393" /LENGTH=363 /DNA_ID=CAMNT_0053838307 /DNA_START=62 /DNA_END=1153 /DNA_ORIENTATION=-